LYTKEGKMTEMNAPKPAIPPHLKASELSEEQKFRNKYPGKKPASTDFLRKRIQKGVKYFDSGDYNMAKSNSRTGPNPLLGKAIPTAEAVTQRKHSTACKSKLADGEEHSPSAVAEPVFFADAEGVQTDENQDQTESR